MAAHILAPTPENIALAAQAIGRGSVVGMPTETVYGLAGLALSETALANIFRTKDRPTFDPLIVHVAAPANLNAKAIDWLKLVADQQLVDLQQLSTTALQQATVLSHLWPGPLTLVLPKQARVPDLATSGLPTVAIRAPGHPVAQALLRAVGAPLAAPSANRFGRISPTSASDVQAELGDHIDFILDGGPCEIGLESTVVAIANAGNVTLLRPGALTREFLEERLQTAIGVPHTAISPDSTSPQASPGLLASHYAPIKPLYMLPAATGDLSPKHRESVARVLDGRTSVGLLLYAARTPKFDGHVASLTSLLGLLDPITLTVRALSDAGDSLEAARNLFRRLREFDADPQVEIIFAEPVPDPTGLGHAIADRLRRAATPFPQRTGD